MFTRPWTPFKEPKRLCFSVFGLALGALLFFGAGCARKEKGNSQLDEHAGASVEKSADSRDFGGDYSSATTADREVVSGKMVVYPSLEQAVRAAATLVRESEGELQEPLSAIVGDLALAEAPAKTAQGNSSDGEFKSDAEADLMVVGASTPEEVSAAVANKGVMAGIHAKIPGGIQGPRNMVYLSESQLLNAAKERDQRAAYVGVPSSSGGGRYFVRLVPRKELPTLEEPNWFERILNFFKPSSSGKIPSSGPGRGVYQSPPVSGGKSSDQRIPSGSPAGRGPRCPRC